MVNTANKVKTITFPATIKLKKTEIKVEAMLDTGASKNLLFETLVPKEDQQTLTQPIELVQYNQEKIIITKYIANVPMIINNITMTLPQTYLAPSISLYPFILGLNFVHSLQGGITIQNNQVSFHPKTTTIAYTNTENKTNNLVCHYTNKIEEIKDSIVNDYSENLKNSFKLKNLLVQAEKIGIIGEDPQKHWSRNKTICKIPIKNPDLAIKTSDIACNLVDTKEFKIKIEELLQNNLIKPSFSPHRSAAFLVRNHSKEKRGKARMVINYKRLNDNTFDDAYKIPNKDSLINSIQECRYFSQLDCKSGFWQVRLHEDSKPWTAFSFPCGLYEWNVMPFGLKNAPQIFQQMMDRIFGKYSFILVYIDDILVFSKTLPEHIKHLCDAPKPGGPLTTRQPAEYKWRSGYPTPLQKIGQSLLCTGSSTQIQTCIYLSQTVQYIQYMSNTATWAHKQYSMYIPTMKPTIYPILIRVNIFTLKQYIY